MSFNSTLDEFCGSTFWDTNLSWNTDNPAFTPCFEKTVLIWVPCSYLWVAAFLDAYYIFNSKERNIPWNILNISKLVTTFFLVLLKLVDLGVTVHKSTKEEAISNADYCAPFVQILTFVLSAKLLHYNKNYGMRASGVLFFFWLLLILAGIPQLRSEIVMHNELTEDENVQYNFVSYMIYYTLIILMFILNCFADLPPKDTPYKFEKNQCPKNASGFPSRLTFSWFDPLAFTGFRRSLTERDLWTLNPEDSSKEVVPRFLKFWERTLQKKEISNDGIATENIPLVSVNFKSVQESKRASILPALCFTFGGQFFFGALLNLINNILMFLSPQLLKLLIEFVDSKEPVWKGYLYVGGLFACATVQTMLTTHFDLNMYLIGMKIRTALTSAIYRKSLRISNTARKQTTVGEIVNLVAVDAQRFLELTVFLNMIWSAPLQITLALYFLWGILGPSVLAGLAVMIVLIPINGVIANRMEKMQIKQMKYKDERVKLMNEVLNGIKVLKMYAWEPSFEEQILKIRNKEVYVLKQVAYLNSTMSLLFFFTPFLVLSAKLLHYNKNYGMRASGVLFFFWLLLILAGIPQLRSEIVMHNELTEDENVQYNFVSYMIYYTLIILMFILNCFADLPPKDTPYKFEKNQCPKNASGFPSRLTFSWFDPLAFTGFRRSLTERDLWTLNPEDSSKEVVPRFLKFWERTLQKKEISNDGIATENIPLVSVNFKSVQESKRASILPALCFTFGGQFFFGALLNLINNILMFLSPQLLKLLIEFVDSKEPVWKGYLYVGGLFACATVQTMLTTHFDLNMYLIGMKIRTALTSAIYRKSLRISNTARKQTTVGEIVNLVAVDAQRFLELTVFLNMIWSAPLQITLALYFLWGILGPSVLAGLAVMIVLIPINGVIANRMEKMQIKQMKYKDERVKLMNEVLNGIKVLKMYAWEPSFEEQILKIRNKEVYVLKQVAYLNSTMSLLFFFTPFLVSLMSFGTFVLVNDDKVLDSKSAFVALSLFNILRMPLAKLPSIISDLVQTFVGIRRLNRFMNFDELNQNSVEHDPKESNPIVIEECHFTWSEDSEPVLKNLNLHIPRGGLVAVVGAVGSGKSSLLSALLGEMNKISGRVNTTGTVAYVPQQAWIQNATLQDNILFGKALEKVKYNNVINVCALKPDFEVLPGGDQTEIGEKGINLSGGQKQRVSLARAVYYDADNYFLDDPLSAVDSHVGKHIFDKVIGPNGLLKNKTRVWVTHNVSYLAQTDLVVVLKDGEVSEAGSYQQLLEKNEAFAEFLLHHLSEAEHASPEELNEIKDEMERKLESEFKNKLERARSLSESTSESEQVAAGDCKSSFKTHMPETTPNELKEKNKLIEAEKAETGSVKWGVYKHYLKSMGVLAATVTVLMNFGMQVFQVRSNYWLSEWSNDDQMMVNGTVDKRLRNQYLGVYAGLGVGYAITSFLSDLMPHLACWRAARILHELLLTKVLRSPLKFFEVTPIGRILSRFSKDVDIMDTSLPSEVTNVMFCIFEVLGTLFVISYSTPIFLTVVLPIGIVYYVIQRFYVTTSRQLKRLESISRSPIYSHFGESITGAQTIRAYGVAERFIEESECGVDFNQSSYYPSIIAHRWLAVRLEMVGNLIVFFSALFVVLGRETINPGDVGLSITYALLVTQTLNWLVRITSEIETNIVAVERIKEYSETKEEAPWTLPAGPGSVWPEKGALELERLSLGYRTGEPVLRDLTCSVAPRDKLGIVGRTGAGKSTLTLGLFRIVEAMSGRILIDGIDIATIGLHQLRSRITIIPQDPVLFAGTLRMNLDPFGTFGDEDVWRALEHAHLKVFTKGLQAGLMHEISEGGENLSVGQRQLVCLARALLRKTPLLVLDEATAAIDLETDDLIQKTIRSEFASCTVLTIAHRLNTIMDSTRVMVLDKGQLVEYAPPEQLLQDKNSIFYSMAKDAGLVN